jgi:hypothetical protein
MPLFMLGTEYALLFWQNSWFLPLLFFLIVGGIDTYFLLNWKLFRLLEEENWAGVIKLLEEAVYSKERISGQRIKLLINAYLLKSNMDGVDRLEAFLREKRPALHSRHALSLGVPRLLRTDAEGLEFFYAPFLEEKRKDRDWIHFLYSFSLLMQERRDDAESQLVSLVQADDCGPVVMLLALYSLAPFGKEHDVVASLVSRKSGELKNRFKKPALEKELIRSREQIIPVMLAKLTEDALTWLYPVSKEEQA